MKKVSIKVYGVKLDTDKKEPEIRDVLLTIEEDEIKEMNHDDLEMFIEDEISNESGFCHFGWQSYKILD